MVFPSCIRLFALSDEIVIEIETETETRWPMHGTSVHAGHTIEPDTHGGEGTRAGDAKNCPGRPPLEAAAHPGAIGAPRHAPLAAARRLPALTALAPALASHDALKQAALQLLSTSQTR